MKKSISDKSVTANIFGSWDYCSIIQGCSYIPFFEYMLRDDNLAGFTNLFSPSNSK